MKSNLSLVELGSVLRICSSLVLLKSLNALSLRPALLLSRKRRREKKWPLKLKSSIKFSKRDRLTSTWNCLFQTQSLQLFLKSQSQFQLRLFLLSSSSNGPSARTLLMISASKSPLLLNLWLRNTTWCLKLIWLNKKRPPCQLKRPLTCTRRERRNSCTRSILKANIIFLKRRWKRLLSESWKKSLRRLVQLRVFTKIREIISTQNCTSIWFNKWDRLLERWSNANKTSSTKMLLSLKILPIESVTDSWSTNWLSLKPIDLRD